MEGIKMLLFCLYMLSMGCFVFSSRCPPCTKPKNDQRVCGTDGRTYPSICYLGRKICRGDSTDLAVAYSGKCIANRQTITSTTPTERTTTQFMALTTPFFREQDIRCNITLDPVCGTDGITYPSICFLKKFASLPGKSDLTIRKIGFCSTCNAELDTNREDVSKTIPTTQLKETNITTTEQAKTEKVATTTGVTTQQSTTRTQRKQKTSRKPKPKRRRKVNLQKEIMKTTTKPTIQSKSLFDFRDTGFFRNSKRYGGTFLFSEATEIPRPTFGTSDQSDVATALGLDFDKIFSWENIFKRISVEPTVKPSKEVDKNEQLEDSFATNFNFKFGGGSDLTTVVDIASETETQTLSPATTELSPTPTTNLREAPYYGKLIGELEQTGNRCGYPVHGTIYAIDNSRIRIVNFTYDGDREANAVFWAESLLAWEIIPDENGRTRNLKSYANQDVILRLPLQSVSSLANYTTLGIFCNSSQEKFATVRIPENFIVPDEHDLGVMGFKPRIHSVRSPAVVIVDTKTIRFHNITYDGAAPDTFFWVGSGSPDSSGRSVPFKMESSGVLPRFRRDTVTVQLPDNLTMFNIDYIGIWSEGLQQDFGHVVIPDRTFLNIPPAIEVPIAKPQTTKPTTNLNTKIQEKPQIYNSESLSKNYQVRWAIDGDEIEIQLSAKLKDNHYMAFGFSGSKIRSTMFGSDVAIAWMESDTPRVDDYYLGGYTICFGGSGVCKDEEFLLRGKNDYKIVNGSKADGVTTVSYRRKLNTGDALDMTISVNEEMFIVWAIGPISDSGLVNKHIDIGGNSFNFGRDPVSNSQIMVSPDESNSENTARWEEIIIIGKDVTIFDVKIGPTGGQNRYSTTSGNADWGSAWYINGKLTPKLILKRGVEYTFRVYGGDDESLIAKYHPFFITDDETGGNPSTNTFKYQTIYAGPAVGGYCEYTNKKKDRSKQWATFDDYFKTLKMKCNRRAVAGTLTWTPDANTPDTVYYQCYTHQYFGWKIEVVDNFL